MNHLVKFLTDDSGVPVKCPEWHYVNPFASDPAALCTGEYFGPGQSDIEYVEKKTVKGGITCSDCLEQIKHYKSIKL